MPVYGPELGPGSDGQPWYCRLRSSQYCNSFNSTSLISFPASQTFRSTSVSVFLCPSSTGGGPVVYQQTSMGTGLFDVAAGQYVGSMGDNNYRYDPDDGSGTFFRNSAVSSSLVTDGLSNTIFCGERSRNLIDSTWVGVVYPATVCTPPRWPTSEWLAPATVTVLAQTGTNDSDDWVEVPNSSRPYPTTSGACIRVGAISCSGTRQCDLSRKR